MSLVEQALRKSREARQSQTAGGQPTAASIEPGSAPNQQADAVPSGGESPEAPVTRQPAPSTVPARERSITLDRDVVRNAGYLAPAEQQNELIEQFRHIKRPLVKRALGRGEGKTADSHVIMITSALPGEGKTFCAFNLALGLAFETDVSVLLMDADFRSPKLSSVLGVDGYPGMGDALEDPSIDPESLVVGTDIPTLGIMPAGRWVDTSPELISSPRMDALMTRLKEAAPNRLIVMDAPPLLLTNEAKALSGCSGQVVLIVRANSTPQQAVQDAIGYLREDQFVGLVLNQSDTVQGLGYGYGYYGGMYEYGRQRRSED